MSILVKKTSKYDLRTEKYKNIKNDLISALEGRVTSAYIFGSFATGKMHGESDLDIILIKETTENFIKRPFEFEDLFDIFPDIDILVYTEAEFQKKINENGFGTSIKDSMIKII